MFSADADFILYGTHHYAGDSWFVEYPLLVKEGYHHVFGE